MCTSAFSLNLSRAEIDTQELEMDFHVELTVLLLWSIGLGGGVSRDDDSKKQSIRLITFLWIGLILESSVAII